MFIKGSGTAGGFTPAAESWLGAAGAPGGICNTNTSNLTHAIPRRLIGLKFPSRLPFLNPSIRWVDVKTNSLCVFCLSEEV